MKNDKLKDKVMMVIFSCINTSQLDVARKYYQLATKQLSSGSLTDMENRNEFYEHMVQIRHEQILEGLMNGE